MKATTQSTGGTSYTMINFDATPEELMAVLGKPTRCNNTGEDKVKYGVGTRDRVWRGIYSL